MSSFLKEAFKERKLICLPEVVNSIAMIVRLQRYQIKEDFDIAKKKEVVKYKDMKIKIFPDVTVEMDEHNSRTQEINYIKHGLKTA